MLSLSGKQFGRLTAIYPGPKLGKKQECTHYCQCECGNYKAIRNWHLTGGHIRSCGCLRHEPYTRTHGRSRTQIYRVWCAMWGRCSRPKDKRYKDYGGRGISVCERWRASFENFIADMGERPPGHSIERINNDGDYEPNNCRWIPASEQMKNSRARHNWTQRKRDGHGRFT